MLHQNIQIIFILFCLFRQNNQNQAQNFTFFFYFGRTSRTEPNHFAHSAKRQASLDRDPWGAVSPDSSSSATVFFAFFSLSPLSTTQHSPSSHSYSRSQDSLAIAAFPCASVTIVLFSTTTITRRTRSRETDAEKEKKKRERERKERELVRSVVANSSRQVVTETDVHVGEENEPCNQWQLQLLLFTRRRRGQGVTLGYGKSWGCGLLEVVRKRQKRDRV